MLAKHPAEGRGRAGIAAVRGSGEGLWRESGTAATREPWQGQQTITPERRAPGPCSGQVSLATWLRRALGIVSPSLLVTLAQIVQDLSRELKARTKAH